MLSSIGYTYLSIEIISDCFPKNVQDIFITRYKHNYCAQTYVNIGPISEFLYWFWWYVGLISIGIYCCRSSVIIESFKTLAHHRADLNVYMYIGVHVILIFDLYYMMGILSIEKRFYAVRFRLRKI